MMLGWNDYQSQASLYRKASADNVYAVLGLCEEAGEVAGKFAKWRRDGTDVERLREDVMKELGDVLWMVAAIATDMSLPMEDVAQANLNKLAARLAKGTISGSGDSR